MRRGGRLSERLTARERDLAGRMKLTFAVHRDSPSLVIMFCNCQIISKLPARHLCVVNHVCTSYMIFWDSFFAYQEYKLLYPRLRPNLVYSFANSRSA